MAYKPDKIVYDLNTLNHKLLTDGATLVSKPDILKRESIIQFKCSCENNHEKRFINIIKKGGAFCKTCTKSNQLIKTKNTFIKKYGVDNPLKNNEIRDKIKKTCIQKYGKENVLLCREKQEKRLNTLFLNYGVINPSNSSKLQEKRKETFIKKYGVDNPLKNKEIKEKQDKTIIDRYGVKNISQLVEIQDKIQQSSRKFKDYKMPSGTIRRVQGYEPYAINELVKNHNEDDIKTNRRDVPRILYNFNNKDKYYFPDIYIPSENKIVEVKSDYTYNNNLDINTLKKEACERAGYIYEFWIYNPKTMIPIIL
jgi:hypothetical protein